MLPNRGITIIPEIEMPGHALAALKAYPNLGCTGGPYETATFWGVFDDVFCAGNDSSFVFLQQVLDEVIQLFLPTISILEVMNVPRPGGRSALNVSSA